MVTPDPTCPEHVQKLPGGTCWCPSPSTQDVTARERKAMMIGWQAGWEAHEAYLKCFPEAAPPEADSDAAIAPIFGPFTGPCVQIWTHHCGCGAGVKPDEHGYYDCGNCRMSGRVTG